MRTIDGQPVGNAAMAIRLTITEKDIAKGAPKNPNACAVALAAVRQIKGVTAAKAHLSCVYLLRDGHWQRYSASKAIRDEIIVFDRGGKFYPGEYDLLPVPTASLIRKVRQIRGEGPRRRTTKRRKPHHIEGVRESAHRNEPPTPANDDRKPKRLAAKTK